MFSFEDKENQTSWMITVEKAKVSSFDENNIYYPAVLSLTLWHLDILQINAVWS